MDTPKQNGSLMDSEPSAPAQPNAAIPSLKEQRETIKFYCEAKLEEGETWYVLEVRWWDSFKRFVNYDEADQEGVTEYPGPIDNDPLVIPSSSTPSLPKLQRYLREQYDFVLVPENAWEKLLEWYGGGPAIPRLVIVEGVSRMHKIELYPHFVSVALYSKKQSHDWKELMFSKADTLLTVKECAAKALDVSVGSDMRLWAAHMNTPFRCYDSTDEEKTLEAVDTRIVGMQLFLEVKDADGAWPLHAKHKSAVQSTSRDLAIVPSSTTSFATSTSMSSARSHLDDNYSITSYGGGYSSNFSMRDNYSNKYKSPSALPGVCGLSNLGNTCFMNSALQCLTKTPQFKDYFINGDYKSEINTDNPLGMGGKIAKAFGDLMANVWEGGNSHVSPTQFKHIIGTFAPQFSGYQQHDSQELIAYLLDGLHEDLNRVRKKPYTEAITSDGRPDPEVAHLSWVNHMKRNDSVIVDRCQAQLKSTLVCPDCSHVSITFDPYLFLSLPLPTERTRVIDVLFFRTDSGNAAVKYGVKVSKRGFVKELRQKLAEAAGARAEDIVFSEIFSGKIYRFLPDTAQTSSIQDNDVIYAYEIKGLKEEHHTCYDAYASRNPAPFLPVRIYTKERPLFPGATERPAPIGFPFAVFYDKKTTTKKQLYDSAFTFARKFLKAGFEQMLNIDLSRPETFFPVMKKQEPQQPSTDTQSTDAEAASTTVPDASMEDVAEPPAATDNEDIITPKPPQKPAETTTQEGLEQEPQQRFSLFTLKLESYYERDDSGTVLDYSDEIIVEKPNPNYPYATYDKKTLALHIDPQLLQQIVDVDKLNQTSDDESVEAERGVTKNITLYDCLNLFTTVEQLGAEDEWYCPKCKKHVQATKKFDIYSLPEVLVVHLKRFQFNRMWRDKLETYVDYPVNNLDLSSYLPPTATEADKRAAVYNLYAVSNHYGGLGGGHYTATAKVGNQWYKFDDSYTSPTDEESCRSKAGYVLFYTRASGITPVRVKSDADFATEDEDKIDSEASASNQTAGSLSDHQLAVKDSTMDD